ncbi:MAG: molybdenum cofactor biosynthesis protein MoaE [Bdellovibrionota bacterium]
MKNVFVHITTENLNPAQALEFLSDPGQGAQTLFLGVVRNNNLGKKVVAVQYDAHETLSSKVLYGICAEAQEKWGEDLKIYVSHRTGKLGVGETSVLIGTGSKHREFAYEASRYVIEELKVRVPVWKNEHYENGESGWLRGHALCSHAGSNTGGRNVHAHGAQ